MESRLAATARATFRVFFGASHHQSLRRGLATALPTRRVAEPAIYSEATEDASKPAIPNRRVADPAVYSEGHEGNDVETAIAEKKIEHKPSEEKEPFEPPKPPSLSPKLESPGVNQPIEPIIQQKRRNTTSAVRALHEDVSCAGLDGSPWPDDREEERRRQRREEEEDYKEYYSHHKASPLSEIELADSRKPITRATDGTADSNTIGYDGVGEGVITWREEQLDTAEEALRRATEIWKQSAMRGDPDSPHGRVLRALRGECW